MPVLLPERISNMNNPLISVYSENCHDIREDENIELQMKGERFI